MAAAWLVLGTPFLVQALPAQFAIFARPTDTVHVSGNTFIGSQATYEARVLLFGDTGVMFNEWQYAVEDKQFGLAFPRNIRGYAHPVGIGSPLTSASSLTLLQWHHVAYVLDASGERIYVDGSLIASRATTGSAGNGASSIAAVGGIFRDGALRTSFRGVIDTLRISSVARYTGTTFIPPPGDLLADASTLILYNFGEAPGSPTIADLSGNGHTGTLGVGFGGATSPTLYSGTAFSGQPNSASARLEVNGIGTSMTSGPFVVSLPAASTLTLTWSGPANQPLILAAGPANPAGTVVPCLGSVDIGTPPGFQDIAILFDGSVFTLGPGGTTSQSFVLPALPIGLITTIQGAVLQPAASPCSFVLTAAFLIEII